MAKTTGWLGAIALCASLAMAACNGGSNGTAGPQQPMGPAPMQTDLGQPTSRGMTVPMYMNLRGPDPMPAGGDIRLDLEVVVNEPISAPVTLQVQVPQGAQLVAGQPMEVLTLNQAGRLYRQYTVRAFAPLQNPVIVTADARDPNNAYGLHSERRYPAAQPQTVAPGNRPPMARPPMPPR